jgi:hypothetical protein
MAHGAERRAAFGNNLFVWLTAHGGGAGPHSRDLPPADERTRGVVTIHVGHRQTTQTRYGPSQLSRAGCSTARPFTLSPTYVADTNTVSRVDSTSCSWSAGGGELRWPLSLNGVAERMGDPPTAAHAPTRISYSHARCSELVWPAKTVLLYHLKAGHTIAHTPHGGTHASVCGSG